MTIDIKQSWFHANWNKPKRMKKVMRRYHKKATNVNSILYMAERYGLEIPISTQESIKAKAEFYWKQYYKLASVMFTYLNGEITQDNFKETIENVYSGKLKCYWKKARPDGYPKWEPLKAESVK